MKKLFQNKLFIVIFCCLISAIFVYIGGRADIPNKGNKTNIFSFQDLDSQADYNVIHKGLPFKYNKTFYKSDPNDSCTICNRSSAMPCTCGMPSQIYYSEINWPIAILNFLVVGIILFLISRVPSWLVRKSST